MLYSTLANNAGFQESSAAPEHTVHVSPEDSCGASDQTMQALEKLCSTRVNNVGSEDNCLAPECAYSYSVSPEESCVAPEKTTQGLEKVV
jgi:hypothetical protein